MDGILGRLAFWRRKPKPQEPPKKPTAAIAGRPPNDDDSGPYLTTDGHLAVGNICLQDGNPVIGGFEFGSSHDTVCSDSSSSFDSGSCDASCDSGSSDCGGGGDW